MKATVGNPLPLSSAVRTLRVFFALLRTFNKVDRAYKVDLVLRWLGYPARLLITYMLWAYLLKMSHASAQQTTTIIVYFVFALFLGQLYSFVRMARDIREEIYGGDITVYLVRPLSHLMLNYSKAVMTIVINAFIAFPFIWAIAFFLTGYIPSLYQVGMFALAFLTGFTITFLIFYTIALTAFFTGEIMGALRAFWIISDFLGGVFLPISLMPVSLQEILKYLPFQFWVYLPASLFSGNQPPESAWQLLLTGLGWIVILWGGYRLIWKVGTSRYSGHSL